MRFIVLLAAIWVAAGSAFAATVGEIDHSIRSGQLGIALDQASALAAADPADRWLTAYVGAHVMLARGDVGPAVATARRLLAARPDDFRVRHLLINALIAKGDYRAAVFHIRRNLAASSDPAVQAQYRALLAQYDKINPSLGMSMTMGANPSSNITRGSGQETVIINGLPFQVDEAAREQAGGTVTVGLTGFRRFAIGESTEIVVSGTANLETAVTDGARDVQTLTPGVQLVRHFDRMLISAGPIAEFQFLDYEPYAKRFGVTAAVSRELTDRTTVSLTGRLVNQDYDDLDYLDGYEAKTALSFRHRLMPSLAATATVFYEHEETKAEHQTFDEGGIKLTLEKQWENGFYTDASVSFSGKRYEGDFPLALEPREDERYEIQVGMAHKALTIFGVMPYVGYRYIRNHSNISLYDYDSNDIVISGRKQF